MRSILKIAVPALYVLVASLTFVRGGAQASPSDGGTLPDTEVLWRLVQTAECSPTAKPCFERNREKGYVVIKDVKGPNQLLLLPTARVAGIDDPKLWSVDAMNLFAQAWAARKWSPPLQSSDSGKVSLALNSYVSRSQDQLHIHIDCLDQNVQALLREEWSTIGHRWKRMSRPLKGHTYFARRINSLETESPLRLLQNMGIKEEDMGRWTLVVAGAPKGSSEFILLSDRSNGKDDWAWGEELQDHSCSE